MASPKTITTYKCEECEKTTTVWRGKCPACGAFSSLKEIASHNETPQSTAGFKAAGPVSPTVRAQSIKQLKAKPIKRTPTGIGELDRVLGGGFVDGEAALLAGQPGAGKSTLCLDMANRFAALGQKVLYSSGEESEQQIALRAARMGITSENIRIINETNLELLLGHIAEEQPTFVIVDSLQTIASSEISGSLGSISQSKEAAHTLTNLAKAKNITIVMISQVIKSGEFAGSEAIQHIVDVTLYFESSEDTPLKFLRATKNRFGDTTEVGIFQHAETGLVEVDDPSGIFLESDLGTVSGASCSFISEGLRQIPVEVQALVTRSTLPTPRKQFNGVNHQRGQIVCAILDKFCGGRLFENDVFVSTVSGVRANDPQADLAVAASMLSSLKGKPTPPHTVFIGELSLTGQVRGSFMLENKLREAERLGFTTAVVPATAYKNLKRRAGGGLTVVPMTSVKDLLTYLTK